jgi:hypothetical protein
MERMQKAFLIVALLFTPSLHALSLIDIQGVMLQRISSFITWPQLPERAMRICIVGDEAFVENLRHLYRNKKLHGLPIEVQPIEVSSEKSLLYSCQIIFFVNNNPSAISTIAKTIKSKNLLLVSSNEEDIFNGATVALYHDNNKFKIIINKNSLQSHNLKADYRLMKLAKVVETPVSNHATE